MVSRIFEEYMDKVQEAYSCGNSFPLSEDELYNEFANCCMTDIDIKDIDRLGIYFDNGATKGCVLSEVEMDYVLKFPLIKTFVYDDDIDIVGFCNAYVIDYYTGEMIHNNEWNDYCFLEKYMSNTFIKEGLGECVCRVELYDEVDGHPIYIQERATENVLERDPIHSYEVKQSYSEYISTHKKDKNFDEDWAIDFIEYHGKEKYEKLIDILNKCDINDLHYGNYGYIEDRPVLIDYSGYKEGK